MHYLDDCISTPSGVRDAVSTHPKEQESKQAGLQSSPARGYHRGNLIG
ncbi:hypothetical protein [Thalassospira sp. GB04J01]|nr:hypothetical protein [Thalassospira sp. GB04J01]